MRTIEELAEIGRVAATAALRNQERMTTARIAQAKAIRDATLDDAVGDLGNVLVVSVATDQVPDMYAKALRETREWLESLKGGA